MSYKKSAAWMFIALWLTVFIVLILSFGYFRADSVSEMRVLSSNDSMIRSVILKANRRHHYLIDGKINGHKVRFMLDTGASSVAVPANLAKKLGLTKLYPATVNTASGTVKAHLSRLRRLEIGPIQLSNVGAVIIPRDEDPPVILLGMSALKRLEFQQNEGELILTQRLK